MYDEMKMVIECCFWHDPHHLQRWNNFKTELEKYPDGMVQHIQEVLMGIYNSFEYQTLHNIWHQQGARPGAWKIEIDLEGYTLPEHKKLRAAMGKPRRKILSLFENIDFAVNVVGLPKNKSVEIPQ